MIWAAYFYFNVCWLGGWLIDSVCEEGEGMREGEETIQAGSVQSVTWGLKPHMAKS